MPEGGAGELTSALVRRLRARGGTLECDAPVSEVVVRDGVATGVRLADGRTIPARRAVLADVGAPALYHELVGARHLPRRLVDDLRRFQYDNGTVKVDWAAVGPDPLDGRGHPRRGHDPRCGGNGRALAPRRPARPAPDPR